MDKFEFMALNPAERYQDEICDFIEAIDDAREIGSVEMFDFNRSSLTGVYTRLLDEMRTYVLRFVHFCEVENLSTQPELKEIRNYISDIERRIQKNNELKF